MLANLIVTVTVVPISSGLNATVSPFTIVLPVAVMLMLEWNLSPAVKPYCIVVSVEIAKALPVIGLPLA